MATRPPLSPVPEPWDDAGWARFGRDQGDYQAPATTPAITPVAKVEPEPIEWLWENRVPYAALTLLDGHPDCGKSSITLDLAARLSTARRMPDGSRGPSGGPVASLLLSTEDTLARPVRGRLEAAEANLELVYGLEVHDEREPLGRPLSFPEDVRILAEAIAVTGAKLVVIDPIMGHLSHTVNANADQEVRRALNPLVRVATQTGAAILMVRHLRKPERKAAATVPSWLEGGGSSGGFGIVRAGLCAAQDPDDEGMRTLHITKHNYGRWAPPIDYLFEQTPHGVGRIRWLPR